MRNSITKALGTQLTLAQTKSGLCVEMFISYLMRTRNVQVSHSVVDLWDVPADYYSFHAVIDDALYQFYTYANTGDSGVEGIWYCKL